MEILRFRPFEVLKDFYAKFDQIDILNSKSAQNELAEFRKSSDTSLLSFLIFTERGTPQPA